MGIYRLARFYLLPLLLLIIVSFFISCGDEADSEHIFDAIEDIQITELKDTSVEDIADSKDSNNAPDQVSDVLSDTEVEDFIILTDTDFDGQTNDVYDTLFDSDEVGDIDIIDIYADTFEDTQIEDTYQDVETGGDVGNQYYEARSVWITRWDYEKSKTTGPQSIANIMKTVADANFNMVYFQVRGRADAYYKSSFEPWASEFTGTLGKDPDWDPLSVAVEEAHKNGLEIHVWINTFTMWSGTTPPPESTPRHIYLSHPEWLVVDSNGNQMALNSSYVFATPGNPAVWDHIINVLSEIALKYNIDGIHFDYIRYPGPNYSYDSVSISRYQEAKSKNNSLLREDWQRAQVTEFLSRAYESIISIKPMLKVTAAVWGIYKNNWGWANVSEGYFDYYQDSQGWMQLGIVDAISPMIYWPMTDPQGERTDYATLALDFMNNSGSRFFFSGLHVYPRNDSDIYDFSEIVRQIEYLRQIGAQGMSIYNYALLKQNNYFDDLKNGPFKERAFVPPMEWK